MNNNNAEITVESPKFVELPIITDDTNNMPVQPIPSNIAADPSSQAEIADPVNAQLQTDKGWYFCIFMIFVTYTFIFSSFMAMSMFDTDYSTTIEYFCDSVIYCANAPDSTCCSANSTMVYCFQGSSSVPCVDIFAANTFIQKYLHRDNFKKFWYSLYFVTSALFCLGSLICIEIKNKEQQKRILEKGARNTSI